MGVRRAIIKFEKRHLMGFILVESDVDPSIFAHHLPRGYHKAVNEKYNMKRPICQ